MNRGEICLGSFPFGGKVGSKLRPVLVLAGPLGPVPEFLVAYMTSVTPPSMLPTDILLDPKLPEYATTNLKALTLLRLHKLATIHGSDLVRSLGIVSSKTLTEVDAKLRTMLNL
ncbi:MAG: type II toxin-antitoxin system PemK/MazF family toxin [Gemmataceae bacterium]|nr:type II toxin-antitoxin system PemK/MazF family toxin [Gemmataceae bacterium]MCI0740428.1 type II toxin-antitoxin system PemK/MazF family toxin [Gemmataceae bacterium]